MLSVPGGRGVPSIRRVTRAVAVCASVTAATEAPKAPSDDKRWQIVETRMRRLGNQPDALVEALHSAQEAFGYPRHRRAALRRPDASRVPPSTVFGVATFYHYFTLKPAGEHTAVVCTGTACYINGASGILAAIRDQLGIGPEGDDRPTARSRC